MTPKKILSLLLCIMITCTLAFAGCGKKEENSKEASTADEVLTVTSPRETSTAASSKSSTEAVTEIKETTKPKETSPSNQNNNSNTNSNAGPVDSQEQKPMTCTVTVSERDYTFELGDKFTYTCYLKTPDKIEDIQAQVLYTGKCLKLISTKEDDIFPIIGEAAIFNLDNPGIIKYNALEIKGMDFDEEAVLVTLTFEVIFGGSASVSNSIEVMTGIDGTLYADLFKLKDDVKIRETIG